MRPYLEASRRLTPQAQPHSASPENLHGAPFGAQVRSERRSMDAECRLQRRLGARTELVCP